MQVAKRFRKTISLEQELPLVARMLEGDTEARNTLVMLCAGIIGKEARDSHFACKMDKSDLRQALYEEVIKSSLNYIPSEDHRFPRFVKGVIRLKVKNLIRVKERSLKHFEYYRDYLIRYRELHEKDKSTDNLDTFLSAIHKIPRKLRPYILASLDFEEMGKIDFREASKEFPHLTTSGFTRNYKKALNQVKVYLKQMDPGFPYDLSLHKGSTFEYSYELCQRTLARRKEREAVCQ